MQSKSFGEWYEEQKREPTLPPAHSSWLNSLWSGEQSDGDVESVGLLSRAKNVGTRISEASDTMKEVVLFFALAVVFFAIAYFVGLPTLLLRPAKFAISFTMGSMLTVAALVRLRGLEAFIASAIASDRIIQSSLYLLSLVLSILSAVVWKSYIGTVTCSLLQVATLVLFVLESFPAGSRVTQCKNPSMPS